MKKSAVHSLSAFSLVLALASLSHAIDLVDIRAEELPPFKVPVVDGKQVWTKLPPPGVGIDNWSDQGSGQISVEIFDNDKAFVICNTGTQPSVFLTLKEPLLDVELTAGKTYEITTSYAIAGDPDANLVFKVNGGEGVVEVETDAKPRESGKKIWVIPLIGDVGRWLTVSEKLKISEGKGQLEVRFTTSKSGEENSLAVRSLVVKEVK